MPYSPFERSYCTARRGLIAGSLFLLLIIGWPTRGTAQSALNRAKSTGPRAIAILEFDTNKHVHLVPVTIMMNGEYYDASAYKAAPVPMALEPETVYEGIRSGVSQGNFTIIKAHQVLGNWVGEGNWEPTEDKPVKKAAPLAPAEEIDNKPPVLRRSGGGEKPAPPAATPTPAPAPPAATPPSKKEEDTITLGGKQPKEQKEAMEPAERPTLKRGVPTNNKHDSSFYDSRGDTAWTVVSSISAVSDTKEEKGRSYHYVLKPDQEKDLHAKVQALVVKELLAHTGTASTPQAAGRPPKSNKVRATSQPKFENVKFLAYDPSTTNEPIFVFEADTLVPDKFSGKELPNHVMLLVREDIYGDLHMLFSSISDPTHRDTQPLCEFVDVVDAEGDGYGELLFRRTFDSGRAFSVYRVIGNQLWPLFEGRP
jgi:hypothetical protein